MDAAHEKFKKLMQDSVDFIENLRRRATDESDKRYFQGQIDAFKSVIVGFEERIEEVE